MTIQKKDEKQVRFWKYFRELPDTEKLSTLQTKTESILPLQGFTLVWRSVPHIALGYEGLFRLKIRWHQWHRYAVEDDMIYVSYSHLQTPFSASDFQETFAGRCVAWFAGFYLYGYLTGYSPINNLLVVFGEWAQRQFIQRNIDPASWLLTEKALYKNAFFLQHFGIEAIAQVFREEWEDFRAYVTAYKKAHASPNFPPTPPCPQPFRSSPSVSP